MAGAHALESQTSPFSGAEMKLLLDEDNTNEGWTQAKQTRTAQLWRKKTPGVPFHRMKYYFSNEGMNLKSADVLLTDLEVRAQWEKEFYDREQLEHFDDFKIVYAAIKMPAPCSDRDIVVYWTVHRQPDRTVLLTKNAAHSRAPPKPHLVRAESFLSGIIMRPDETDPSSSRITVILQNDLRGWIPSFVVNYMNVDAAISWHNDLVKFHRDVYSKGNEKQ